MSLSSRCFVLLSSKLLAESNTFIAIEAVALFSCLGFSQDKQYVQTCVVVGTDILISLVANKHLLSNRYSHDII